MERSSRKMVPGRSCRSNLLVTISLDFAFLENAWKKWPQKIFSKKSGEQMVMIYGKSSKQTWPKTKQMQDKTQVHSIP